MSGTFVLSINKIVVQGNFNLSTYRWYLSRSKRPIGRDIMILTCGNVDMIVSNAASHSGPDPVLKRIYEYTLETDLLPAPCVMPGLIKKEV